MFDSNLKTHSPALPRCPWVSFCVVASTMAMMLIMLVGASPIEAQQSPAAPSTNKPAKSKVIPINAKFRDVSTENLSGDARAKARSRNSQARKVRNEALKAARDGISSGNMVPVKEYMNGYVFPQMTQPEQLKESGSLRDNFFRTFLKPDVSAANRKKLISEVILPAMQAIATGKDYSPSARLNAITLVGRLDESALIRNGTRVTPPRPSSAAFGFLSGQLKQANSPAWLKVGAVQGLVRHLQVDQAVNGKVLTKDQRDLLETFAINTLDGKTAGQANWSKDLDYWLKRRSIQLLGAIGRPGAGGKVIGRLVSIAGDETQTSWMQLDAVKSLRTIDFTGANQAQVSKVMVTVTQYLQRQLTAEDKAIGLQLEELIYKNILYGDTDFVASGSHYPKNIAKGGNRGRMAMMSSDEDEMMGGSMRKMNQEEEPVFLVELPNYQLNLIRRRMKIHAFTANDVLQMANGLDNAASDRDKQLRLAIDDFTKDFLKNSDIGLVDISKADEEDEDEEAEVQKKSYTSQLQEVCKNGATKLQTILTRHADGGALGDAPGGESKPAGALPF